MTRTWTWLRLTLGGLLILSSLLLPLTASAQEPRFFIGIVDEDTPGVALTSFQCRVFTQNTNTQSSIFSDRSLATAITQPITASNRQCEWYISGGSTATLDVQIIVTGGTYQGRTVRVNAVTAAGPRRAIIPRTGTYVIAVPFSNANGITTTTYNLPPGTVILGGVVEVTSAVALAAGELRVLDAGVVAATGGPQYICRTIDLVTTGFKPCDDGLTVTTARRAIAYSTSNHSASGYLYFSVVAP